MPTCETITLCPDLEVRSEGVLSEPIEVGPFREGRLFVRLREVGENAGVDVDIGVSPTGYEDWASNWVPLDSMDALEEERMYATGLSNFGNWLRLRLRPTGDPDHAAIVQAWFVGK